MFGIYISKKTRVRQSFFLKKKISSILMFIVKIELIFSVMRTFLSIYFPYFLKFNAISAKPIPIVAPCFPRKWKRWNAKRAFRYPNAGSTSIFRFR